MKGELKRNRILQLVQFGTPSSAVLSVALQYYSRLVKYTFKQSQMSKATLESVKRRLFVDDDDASSQQSAKRVRYGEIET